MPFPNPNALYPLSGITQVCFLKNIVTNPAIEIGDYTYYDDPQDVGNFERNVLYHYPFSRDKLIIGKFCAIARGVTFIMNDANHKLDGFSSYPFYIFGNGWEVATPTPDELPFKGDTRVGNDVWIGYSATIMAGVSIGDGAIVAAKSVVTKDVPPYAIVGGNPARVVRLRFSDATIARLLEIAWWHWDIEKITRNLPAIVGCDLDALACCS